MVALHATSLRRRAMRARGVGRHGRRRSGAPHCPIAAPQREQPMAAPTPFRMTVCGLDELPGHCAAGVTHVLSILDPEMPAPSAPADCQRLELRFHDVIEPSANMHPPGPEHVRGILGFGRELLAAPNADAHLVVHCHAGVSRSTAAMLLILAQAEPGRPAAELAAELLRIRAKAWPNLRIVEFGDQMLGRGGTLIGAAAAIYRHQLEQRQHLAEVMIGSGRGREIAAAQAGNGRAGDGREPGRDGERPAATVR